MFVTVVFTETRRPGHKGGLQVVIIADRLYLPWLATLAEGSRRIQSLSQPIIGPLLSCT